MKRLPSRLEYARAFDQAAAWLDGFPSERLALLSTAEFVSHFVLRCDRPFTVTGGPEICAQAAELMSGGFVADDVANRSRVLALDALSSDSSKFSSCLWASPQRGSWRADLRALDALLDRQAQLCVLTATPLGGLVNAIRSDWQPGEPEPLSAACRRELSEFGWRVFPSVALGSLQSAGWAVAVRLTTLFGRPDLADRAEHAHHQSLGGARSTLELFLASR